MRALRFGVGIAVLVIGVSSAVSASANRPNDDALGEIAPADKTCRPPKYPAASLQAGESGTVILAILVAADGSAKQVEVKTSSGYGRLDRAAIETFRNCKFTPPMVNGAPGEAWGLMRFSFVQDLPPSLPIPESFAQIWHLQFFVTAMSARCLTHYPDSADALATATTAWHARNDELFRKLHDEEQRYYAETSQAFKDTRAEEVAYTRQAMLQTDGMRSTSFAQATFEGFSEPEQQAYCRRFIERLDSEQLDLLDIVMRFPELEAAIAPAADAPSP